MNIIILMGGSNRRVGKEKAFLKVGNKPILEIILEKLNQIRKKGDRIIIVANNISSLQGRLSKFFSSCKETISSDLRESISSALIAQKSLTAKSHSRISPGRKGPVREGRNNREVHREIRVGPKAPSKFSNGKKLFSRHGPVDAVGDLIPGTGPLGGIYSGLAASSTKYNFVLACDMPFLNVNLIQYMLRKKTDYDVLIPKYGDYFEPLHAVYSKSIIPVIKEKIEQGTYRIQSIFPLTPTLSPKGRGNKNGISNRVKVKYITEREMEQFGDWRQFFFNINTPSDLRRAQRIAGSSGAIYG